MPYIPKIWLEPIAGFDIWKNSDDFYFNVKIAKKVCDFLESNIKHSKGEFAGHPLKLEKWEKQIFGHLFGWKRKKDNTRRFRKIFIYIPRKNGKSFVASCIGLIFFIADDEPGSEVYSLAASTEQAELTFKEAVNIVKQNTLFSSEITIFKGYKSMKNEASQSYWKVLSSEAGVHHGLNPHAYIIDELHVQKKSELMEVMETGIGMRRQPLGVYITTADYSGDSPCNRMLDYAKKVKNDSNIDLYFFPVIYELLNDKDDWMDEKNWYKSNPNLGVSVKLDFLRTQFKKAKEEPSYENIFKRLHLNMQTEQERRWLKIEDWDNSGQKIDKEVLKGKLCYAGIDLSSTKDISAFILYFPEYFACLCWFWIPEITAKKKIEYQLWNKQGYCYLTAGNVINYEEIREKILEIRKEFNIQSFAYDTWNASQFAIKLSDEDGFEMVQFGQGFKSMNEPSKELEKLILERKLVHFGNPVLRWMASNVQVKEDPAGNIKPVKANKDSPKKIDGIVALVMALGLATQQKPEENSAFDNDNFDETLKKIYG